MDRLTAMASFVRVVERGSFAAAAAVVGMSPAMIGNHVRFLEKRLGEPLLNRSTRRQAVTDFGRDYYERCRRILEEVEAADAAGGLDVQPSSGTLRITAPVILGTLVLAETIARHVREHPAVKVELLLRDDRLDLLSERIDVALRIGELPDSTLTQRALDPLRLVTCASPAYLRQHGRPEALVDLGEHDCLAFLSNGPSAWRLETPEGMVSWPVSGPVRVNSAYALRSFALAGLGIAMLPLRIVEADLRTGALCQVLPEHTPQPLAMHFLTLPGRLHTPKVRRFVEAACADWQHSTRRGAPLRGSASDADHSVPDR